VSPIVSKLNAGRHRACRRFLLLIYATGAAYFFYAPWDYLLLGALLLSHAAENLRSKSSGASKSAVFAL